MDYSQPARPNDFDAYVRGLAEGAVRAYQSIQHRPDIAPGDGGNHIAAGSAYSRCGSSEVGARSRWRGSEIDFHAAGRRSMPSNKFGCADPTAELKLQAIRIGDSGITAIPDEVYGITGID